MNLLASTPTWVLALSLLATSAFADDAKQAEEHFQAGVAAYARHEFTLAAREFEAAHRSAPRAVTILNAARAWDAAEDRPRASDAYAEALALGGLSSTETAEAKRRLAALEKKLGVLGVARREGTLSVGHVSRATLPANVHLEPGRHDVTLTDATGTETTTSVEVRAGAVTNLEVASRRETARQQPAPARDAKTPVAPERQQISPGSSPLPWVLLAGSVASAGAAVYLGISALDARDRYDASNHADLDAYDRAKSLRLWTNVAWGASILLGGTGVYLLVRGSPAPPRRATALWCIPGAGLWCSAAF